MKPLIPQTVYIPTKNKSDFGVIDPTFGESDAYVKTCYLLSKEELIELLGKTFEAGSIRELDELVSNMNQTTPNKPTKEQFITNLIK